jgi:hypothetical protein
MLNLLGKGDDPKPTKQQLLEANIFAKQFAKRKGHLNPELTHVGNKIPQFVDASGKPLPKNFTPVPAHQINQQVPSYVKELEWDETANMPFYKDSQSGDIKYVNRDLFFTDRYNPRRTYARNSILDYAKR